MQIFDMLSICWKNLTRRKLRTVLTALGVVIGVCAILVMISIGIGLEKYFESTLADMGDLTLIEVNNWRTAPAGSGGSNSKPLVLDGKAVAEFEKIDGVLGATPFWRPYDVQFNMKTQNGKYATTRPKTKENPYTQSIQVYGVYPEALEKMGYNLKSGEMFSKNDKPFTVIVGSDFPYRFIDLKRRPGKNDMRDAWPDENGEVKDPFFDITKQRMVLYSEVPKRNENDPDRYYEVTPRVKGVLERDDKDWQMRNAVFMDINDLKLLIEKTNRLAGNKKKVELVFDEVRVKCESIDDVLPVQKQIEAMGFGCFSMESMRESMQQQSRMIQMVLGGLAAISLFVAAIGIANTMVMSIIERTKEIGIMKVIGAELNNIRTMFLMEAGMIGLLGGIIGVAFSYIISFVINFFTSSMGRSISIIPIWLVGFALLFSILIGVIFGFLPANRAVKISALEAIKHD